MFDVLVLVCLGRQQCLLAKVKKVINAMEMAYLSLIYIYPNLYVLTFSSTFSMNLFELFLYRLR